MLVQLQLEAMQLKQRLTVAALKTKLGVDPAMPAVATAVLIVPPTPVADSPASACAALSFPVLGKVVTVAPTEPVEPVVAVYVSTYDGVDRRKRC
jgi:hypothetical protein